MGKNREGKKESAATPVKKKERKKETVYIKLIYFKMSCSYFLIGRGNFKVLYRFVTDRRQLAEEVLFTI